MADFFFRMKRGVYPYEHGQVVHTRLVDEFRHYVCLGHAEMVEKSVYEAAADARAAPLGELPLQEEEAGEGIVGASTLPEAPKSRKRRVKTETE
jgi:hypothetical protein